MKHRITAALERFSRAMLAPLSYLSAAGLLLVVGALLTSAPLAGVLPFLRWEPVQLAGRIIYKCLTAVISMTNRTQKIFAMCLNPSPRSI